ncbi:palmitoleoyl-protein carboxylesterase NOTUM [Stomoxys calcitrans]|uniref:palmitoleoyl-protein carboxylesterase NOTUM n=1 Tax=Stomoxys calcitrans TaxID=35570 RepID=UPI0027E25FF0|nr:palmitoleoyl-protein carboxylesterase NOTUM [Stomoxys calcitrans]
MQMLKQKGVNEISQNFEEIIFSSNKWIKCNDLKTQPINGLAETQKTHQMKFTTPQIQHFQAKTQIMARLKTELLLVAKTKTQTTAVITACVCRQTCCSTNQRLLQLTQICLLFILAIICSGNFIVTAAPSHQSQTSGFAVAASLPLLSNTILGNAINASSAAVQEEAANTLTETNSVHGGHHVAGAHNHEHGARALKKALLTNRSIVCNDGSAMSFYLRKNPNSKKWIVFLEGGWHCYDVRSCRARWNRLRHLMTSTDWPDTRDVGGILSPLPEENPYWHSANHVLVPYCSSDSWSGTNSTIDSSEFSFRFMGALILKQVIADLIPMGLGRVAGAELLLVGSSAGGLGVMLNLDRIAHYLQVERKLQVTVRGVSDSGWFLDREPYTPSAVASSEAVRQGWSLWKGLLPEACVEQYKAEPWRCYFGYRLYPTMKTPLFVFQWLFDEAQMRADNVAAPVTPHQWNYIHAMGGALRSSLDNVTAVFAPSCIGHAVLSKREWLNLKIDEISLPTALRCWEHSTRPRKKRHDKLKRSTEATISHKDAKRRRERQQQREQQREKRRNNENNGNVERKRLTKEERQERKRLRHEQQKRRQERRNRRKNNLAEVEHESNLTNAIPSTENSTDTQHQRKEHKKRKRTEQEKQRRKQKKRQRRKKEHNSIDANDPERELQKEQPIMVVVEKHHNNASKINRRSGVPRVPERCSLRLLERCSWPQCNHSCPTLTNPVTGEEMRFLELLASFGLDIEAVATALGVDMQTLNNMDRTELVNLLTQQVS